MNLKLLLVVLFTTLTFSINVAGQNDTKTNNTLDAETTLQKQRRGNASQPKVSPDGKRIAFVSDGVGGEPDLYIVDADGSNLRRLTNTPEDEGMHSWSSDGSRLILRRSSWATETHILVVMNADGTGEHVIDTGQKGNSVPSFSPDGKQIVLNLDGSIGFGIFAINADGSNPRKLTRGSWPALSPDGKQIAFSDNAEPSGRRIFVINVDGTNKRQVSTGDGAHECPAWSRDGKRIAYQALLPRDKASGKSKALVRVVNADGSGDYAVSKHSTPYLDEMPSWFPDGKRLAIQSDRDGVMRLYIIDLNGKVLMRLAP